MSLSSRVVSHVRPLVASSGPLRVYSRNSSTSYPFTKPSGPGKVGTSASEQGTKAAHPFTRPHEPTQVAGPTTPVARPGPPLDDSPVISRDADEPGFAKPDYAARSDYRNSSFSPVPLRVRDGSEPIETTAAAVVSGAPTELQARTVRIYKPTKTATQSGDWHGHHWSMDWDILQKGHRWENPLMGWQSSADFVQGTKLTFKTKEDAIRFAEKQGYEYYVQEPQKRRIIPKAYANQFLHSAGPLKQVRTK